MNALAMALSMMDLFNKSAPGIASFIGVIKGKDDKVTVLAIADDTEATNNQVLDMVAKWKADNGK